MKTHCDELLLTTYSCRSPIGQHQFGTKQRLRPSRVVLLEQVGPVAVATVYEDGSVVAIFVGRDPLHLYRDSPFFHPPKENVDSGVYPCAPVVDEGDVEVDRTATHE